MKFYVRRAVLLLAFAAAPAHAQLDLQAAIRIAQEQDPRSAAALAAAEAAAESAVADAQWADPTLKLGIVNLPTDTFAFDEQPMTQKVIGISQKFPRGNSAALAGERGAYIAESGYAGAADLDQALAREVGIAFLTVAEQLRVRELLTQNRRWMQELVGYNRARLATAQIQSQQLLQSQLALARLDDRIAAADGEINRARGELSRWIGAAAWGVLEITPPAWADTRDWVSAQSLPVPMEILEQHPAVAASSARVAAERADVALAEEAYKPQFGVDISYGQRDRTPMSDGADFASVMLSFDLPLFHRDRQDRRLAASRARESAGMLQRQNLLQQLHAELNGAVAMAQSLDRRHAEYRETLLGQAEATADAVLKGYASNTADLEAVIAARMDAIETQISAARLNYNYFRALARVRYFRAIPGDGNSK
ncbi:TolC family protein [Microbulbifer harenosus]|uniref:TolC family protein n=1 Tax=Microbulbifer harenosus TaxID=2576840 RepID=A0ABY2UMK2_9GAMM|nr:TolC family protein [Microbulbifer harenosus]TLM78996.1 TolC family protein [Microbulbifer harenosus]